MSLKLVLTAFATILSLCIQAQEKLTPESLWKIGRVSELRADPDKRKIIYGIRNYDLTTNKSQNQLYLYHIKTNKTITLAEASLNGFSARFTPDGRRIGFLSAKSGELQIWEMDTNGKNIRQVTNTEGGVNGFHYSPDGKKIVYFKEVKLDKTIQELYPDLPLVKARIIDGLMYRHWDQWEDEQYSHIFWVNYSDGIITGSPTDIMKDQRFDAPLQPMGGEEQICWSPDAKSILYTSKKCTGTEAAYSTNSDLFKYDLETGVTTNLTEGMSGYDQDPQMPAGLNKLYWLSMERPGYESDKNRIMCYDFEMKKKYEITSSIDRSTDAFKVSADGKYIFAIIISEGTKQLFKINSANLKAEPISHVEADYTEIELLDDNTIIAARQSISRPTELYILQTNQPKQSGNQITHQNDKFYASHGFGKTEKRMVKTSDGKDMLCWVTYPPDFDKNKKYPALLFCQGGPQSPVSQFFSYRWNFQLMAAKGYIVIAPNRRGLQGFGKDWNDAIMGEYGGQCMTDLLSAIDDLCKEKYIDKDKLGCVGASFGGYSAYWLAGHHGKRFKAFIAHCGMFNMESWYGTTEEMFFAKNDQKGPYWSHPENYQKFSPHHFVKNWDTPILIIHNEKDFRVPLGQGMEAFTAAQSLNIPSRFLYFPDENHWVTKPQNAVLWQRVFFDWLGNYLR